MGNVKRRTEGSAHRHGGSPTASPDRSGPPVIAEIRLDDRVSDVVASPINSVAYAALSDSIAVINSLHEVSCVIPIGGHPRDLAIDAYGSRLYATNYGGSVSVIDLVDYRVETIPGACRVQRIDTADGALLYAAGNVIDGPRRRGLISVIGAGAVVAAIAGFDGHAITGLAADPERERLYVGLSRPSAYYQYDTGLVGVIDATTNAAIHTIDLGASPDTITISPDGSMIYATHYDRSSVSAIDRAGFRVTPIALGDSPLGVRFTPDGSQAYVPDRCSLSVIDTVANEATPIAVGDLPRCVRISPDGKHGYVSNFGDGTVSVIDTITRSVTETIDVGGHPEALALSADGECLYVGDYWSGTVTMLSVQP
jgi:YVTN family beta-propeller protein